MTIVQNQIQLLVTENGAIVIVAVNDRDSLTFQCGRAQEWFAHARHVKRDLYQSSPRTVRRRVTINNVMSFVLHRHVVCHLFCSCFVWCLKTVATWHMWQLLQHNQCKAVCSLGATSAAHRPGDKGFLRSRKTQLRKRSMD